jgi:hypothetical protein
MPTNVTSRSAAAVNPCCVSAIIAAAAVVFSLDCAPPNALGSDVSGCFLRKVQGFMQTSAAMPAWRTPYPFAFQVDASVESSDALLDATLVLPDGSLETMTWDPLHSYRPPSFGYRENFTSAQELEDACTNGTYFILLDTANDGFRVIALDLLAPVYPDAPWVVNFDAAQRVDTRSDFVLRWAGFAGATTNDSIVIEIWSDPSSRVFATPDDVPFSATNTSIVVPRNTLAPGKTYVVFLVFLRITDRDEGNYPGVSSKAGCDTYTVFQLRALPELHISVSNNLATVSWPSPATGFDLETNADPGRSDQWNAVTNLPSLVDGWYSVTLPATNRAMFYRLNRY